MYVYQIINWNNKPFCPILYMYFVIVSEIIMFLSILTTIVYAIGAAISIIYRAT